MLLPCTIRVIYDKQMYSSIQSALRPISFFEAIHWPTTIVFRQRVYKTQLPARQDSRRTRLTRTRGPAKKFELSKKNTITDNSKDREKYRYICDGFELKKVRVNRVRLCNNDTEHYFIWIFKFIRNYCFLKTCDALVVRDGKSKLCYNSWELVWKLKPSTRSIVLI